MLGNKYSNFLTILLVIIIVAVVAGVAFLGYTIFKPGESTDDAIKRFEDNIGNNIDNNETTEENADPSDIVAPEDDGSGSGGSSSGGSGYNKQYYKGFVMIGYVEIKQINIKYPILEKGTDKALEEAVAIMYPDNPTEKLNKPGNVVIMGHNYRNGKFFSNNKKLSTGDKITITDYTGKKVTYTIYEKFETTPEDTSFITRDTKGKAEITLSTCTDDTMRRLIIKAKAD